ncbi:MAG: DUF5684 domain-containing protein [Actinobacteria bacterium]|nr:DUF5684 domain-containing protein [Actinomycetota bacterium]MCL5447412.1 DUF5684 domain-containing protein [Actinomycetota bacterium]
MDHAALLHTTSVTTYHTVQAQLPSQANTPPGAAAGIGIFIVIVYLAILVLYIVASWRIFTKAGQPGWAAIIPIYNTWVLLKIVGRPGWWLILLFIPFVNIIFAIIVMNDLSKSFGHDAAFTVGLALLSFIFFPILAFGKSRYIGPSALQGIPATGYPGYPGNSGYPGSYSGPPGGFTGPGGASYGPAQYGGTPASAPQAGTAYGPAQYGGTMPDTASGGYAPIDPFRPGNQPPMQASPPVQAGPAPFPTTQKPDWYPDPSGRHQQRYWNGSVWTEHVVDNGIQATDPL